LLRKLLRAHEGDGREPTSNLLMRLMSQYLGSIQRAVYECVSDFSFAVKFTPGGNHVH
jgi:hypothetical protein